MLHPLLDVCSSGPTHRIFCFFGYCDQCLPMPQAGLPWGVMQRLTLLSTAAHLMPTAPTENLLQRNVLKEFAPAHAAHLIALATHAYPFTTSHLVQPSGDRVIVCCDHPSTVLPPSDTHTCTAPAFSVPCFVPFSTYARVALGAPPGTALPELPLVVYPIASNKAAIRDDTHSAVLTRNVWLRARTGQVQVRSVDGAVATFVEAAEPHLVVHGTHGMHAVVERGETVAKRACVEAGDSGKDAKGAQATDTGDVLAAPAVAMVRSRHHHFVLAHCVP